MKITLKKIEYSATLSEETNCFSAQVWIDGAHAFDASNHGHGGATLFRQRGAMTEAEANAAIQADPATFPPLTGHAMVIPADLEIVADELLSDWLLAKDLRRQLARKALWVTPEGVYECSAKGRSAADILPQLRAKHPERVFLNDMPLEAALKAYREASPK